MVDSRVNRDILDLGPVFNSFESSHCIIIIIVRKQIISVSFWEVLVCLGQLVNFRARFKVSVRARLTVRVNIRAMFKDKS